MNLTSKQLTWFGAGALWGLVVGLPAVADDTELFTGSATAQGAPNILFILDDSISMGTNITTRELYNPATVYAGSCSSSQIYWKSGSDGADPPNCATSSTSNWFNASAQYCDRATQTMANTGYFSDRIAQFDDSSDIRWENLSSTQKDRAVECATDSPAATPPGHGDGINNTKVYAQDGTAGEPWSPLAADEIDWSARNNYVLYSHNYINWWYTGPTTTDTRLNIMKAVANDLLDSINGVNVGLMDFNYDAGGRVSHAIEDIAIARGPMQTKINALTPSTYTPLSETLYEAGLYFMGRAEDQGVGTDPNALNGSDYDSPIDLSCVNNYAIILTDGEPRRDDGRDTQILGLADEAGTTFSSLVGSTCDVETYDPSLSPSGGDCLDDLAEFLFEGDLSDEPGQQNLATYTVGFDIDLSVLKDAANRGGGEYRTANDAASLTAVLTDLISKILEGGATFSAPAVSVNSFNRTRNLNDLFISVFSPKTTAHWPGNLKKYRLRVLDSQIIDADGDPAVDASGFFAMGSRSYWSIADDGPNVEAGGAANRIPPAASRNVYTHFAGNPVALSDASNAVDTGNGALTDAVLNSGGGRATRDQVIDFIRGAYTDGSARNQMGDPLHAQPVTVIYDGGDPDAALVFFATNDGYLHAINPNTGVEQWSFVPEEFLGDQIDLLENEPTANKHYGIDGSLRLQVLANSDAMIDPASEKVYLTFGMRRGGNFYYSLDVTERDNPKLLWRRGAAELAGNGQSWANATPARMNIDHPLQSPDKLVLVIGGGYDTTQDNYSNIVDNNGNAIYIVDSADGDVLWRGSKSSGDKLFPQMSSSMPADIKVIDMNADGYADRMYASDTGGQVWRFDVINGEDPPDLVRGGVIAQLGAAPLPDSPPAVVADGPNNRRFFYSPDVALVSNDDFNFVHVGIGSGYRSHPLSTANQDRFYALRDYYTFGAMTDMQYASITPITDADLVDVTGDVNANVPQGAPGWKLLLNSAGSWIGEKVLAESRTFNNQVFFTTFIPSAGGNPINPCSPSPATNRLYIMSLFNGAPVVNLDEDATEGEEEDRYREFPGTIASEVVFIFPSPDDPASCVGDQCTPPPVACVDLFCFSTNFLNNPIRTFWSEESIDIE